MGVKYTFHAKKRMKQRGITRYEIEEVFSYPSYIKKTAEGLKEYCGIANGKRIIIIAKQKEKYIRIITVIGGI